MKCLWFAAALLLVAVPVAADNDYPVRNVTIVVPFAPGSGTDVMARELADELGKRLGKPFIVDNRPGANGLVAAEYAARANPDGYTLFMGGNTTHSANPHLFKMLKYDPVRDFTPIARLATAGAVLVVSPKTDIRSVDGLVRAAKTAPGKLTYGAPDSGSQVAMERIKKMTGIDVTRVPYRSSPQAANDVIGGSISMTFLDVAAALAQVTGGQLLALAISSPTRAPQLPDVPTLQEAGLSGFDIIFWNGLFGPANLPAGITAKLDGAAQEAMQTTLLRNRLTSLGLTSAYLPAAAMGEFVRRELIKWGELIRDADIEPN